MEKGLSAANAECSVCMIDMLLIKKDSSDVYVLECRKKVANAHRIKRFARKNSCFEESKLKMLEILMFMNMWVRKSNRNFISFELNVSKKTVANWIGFFRGMNGKSPTEDVKAAHPKNHTTALSTGIKANHPRLKDGYSVQRVKVEQRF
ncbi:hypothetical protein TNCV_3489191 [Trichonephila clavipes]|nr:hypothetical protein TNCV_3489191 [Trichonephila clavipes]